MRLGSFVYPYLSEMQNAFEKAFCILLNIALPFGIRYLRA